MERKWKFALIGCAGLALLALLALGAGLVWLGRYAGAVEGIEVALEAPALVRRGETFPIVARVRNTAAKRQTLVDLDVGRGYLRGIAILSAEPAWKQSTNLLGTATSYNFELPIEPGTELRLELRAKALRGGEFSGDFDFCINSEIQFLTQQACTRVER